MRVDPKDGRCRECRGTLTIIDADDATMTVECDDCGDVYLVETDAFGDGDHNRIDDAADHRLRR